MTENPPGKKNERREQHHCTDKVSLVNWQWECQGMITESTNWKTVVLWPQQPDKHGKFPCTTLDALQCPDWEKHYDKYVQHRRVIAPIISRGVRHNIACAELRAWSGAQNSRHTIKFWHTWLAQTGQENDQTRQKDYQNLSSCQKGQQNFPST